MLKVSPALWLVLLAALAPPALADRGADGSANLLPQVATQPGLGLSSTDVFGGSFVQTVPIEVPSWRGQEPHLGLTYRSGERNGAFGVGWTLTGASEIVRTGASRGAPTFTPSDTYVLDGMELVPCANAGASPGCQAGGNYVTRTESYSRVSFDGWAWTITARDGTVATYRPASPNSPVSQWVLTGTSNPRGSVSYGWNTCLSNSSAPPRCYLTDVAYGGVLVHLYLEPRPDWIMMASGRAALDWVTYRYNAIDVSIGGSRIRTYALGYTQASDTGASLLTTVARYGKDAAVDASGHVVSGTRDPATLTATYSQGGAAYFSPTITAFADVVPGGGGCVNNRTAWCRNGYDDTLVGDFDGDGKSDVLLRSSVRAPGAGGFNDGAILLGTTIWNPFTMVALWASPGGMSSPWTSGVSGTPAGTRLYGWLGQSRDRAIVADFDGDGASDLLLVSPDARYAAIAWGAHSKSQPLGSLTWLWNNATGTFGASDLLVAGDFNGDGRSDLMVRTTGHQLMMLTGTGSRGGPFTTAVFGSGCYNGWCLGDADRFQLGDFNGDGKVDLFVDNGATSWLDGDLHEGPIYRSIWTATGNPYAPFTIKFLWTPSGGSGLGQRDYNGWTSHTADQYYIGDFNGDGKSDLAVSNNGAWFNTYSIFNPDQPPWVGWCTLGSNFCGPTAVVMFSTGSADAPFAPYPTLLWTPTGPTTGSGSGLDIGLAPMLAVGDVNGDHLSDLLVPSAFSGTGASGVNALLGTASARAPFARMATYGGAVSQTMGDFNGDGLSEGFGTLSLSGVSGLMTRIDNGLGASTWVSYAPSSTWANTNLPFITQTVTALDVNPGYGQVAHTAYDYSGGRYDALERRFLGFGRGKETRPCVADTRGLACPYRETWFNQDFGATAKPSQINEGVTYSDLGLSLLYKETHNSYATNGNSVPYTSLESSTWSIEYDGSGASCATWPCAHGIQRYAWFGHDAYGNITSTYDYGDYNRSGDERYETTQYIPNTAAYIVSLPATVSVYDASTWALLNQSQLFYDGAGSASTPPSRGLQTQLQRWLDTPNSWVTRSFGYDAWGNLTSETDENAHTTQFTFDAVYHRFPASTTNALNQTSVQAYDPVCGVASTTTDANQQVTRIDTDALCRPLRVTDPTGSFTAFSYCTLGGSPNACGSPTAQYVQVETPSADGAGNQWTRNYYDGRGRVYRSIAKGPSDRQPIVTDVGLGTRGLVAWRSRPYYQGETMVTTGYLYDGRDRLVKTTFNNGYGGGDSTSWTYGFAPCPATASTCTSVTAYDELGHPTTTLRDSRGNVAQRIDNRGATTFAYDARDALAGVTDAAGNRWTYSTDSLGRNLTSSDPDAGAWSYGWDAHGNLARKTDARQLTTSYWYDPLDRKTMMYAYDVATGNYDYGTWSYDEPRAAGNVGHVTSSFSGGYNPTSGWQYGGQSWDYDAAGRVTSTTRSINGASYTVSRGYDPGGRLAWVTFPDGDTAGTSDQPLRYDGAGRPLALPGIVTSATYDAAGHLLARWNANCTATRRQYSRLRGWLDETVTTKECAGTPTTTLLQLDYARDAEGKPNSVSRAGAGTWSYYYDGADRMYYGLEPTPTGYIGTYLGYDAVDNIQFQWRVVNNAWNYLPYGYPAPGQPHPHAATSIGGVAYQYDANGNASSAPSYSLVNGTPTPSAPQAFTYDTQNRLVGVGATTYRYDASNERTMQNGRVFVNDDIEIDEAGTMTKYLWFAGERVAKRVGRTTTYWLHGDQAGSVNLETGSGGDTAVFGAYQDYYPFGAPVLAGKPESLGFTGERQDATTGLVYLHARYYDPYIARFLAPDLSSPASPAVGINRYAYANNNPIVYTDHTGHDGVVTGFTPLSDDPKITASLASYTPYTPEGLFIFAMHSGYTDFGIRVPADNKDGSVFQDVEVSDIATVIATSKSYLAGTPILLDACFAGALEPGPGGGGPGSGLAQELGTYVVAPMSYSAVADSGIGSFSRHALTPDGMIDTNGLRDMWSVFGPDGTRLAVFESPVGGLGKIPSPVLAEVAKLAAISPCNLPDGFAEQELADTIEGLAPMVTTPSLDDALLPIDLSEFGAPSIQSSPGFDPGGLGGLDGLIPVPELDP